MQQWWTNVKDKYINFESGVIILLLSTSVDLSINITRKFSSGHGFNLTYAEINRNFVVGPYVIVYSRKYILFFKTVFFSYKSENTRQEIFLLCEKLVMNRIL